MDKAFELLLQWPDNEPDLRYEVKVRRSDSTVSNRGVYLRNPVDTERPINHVVEVIPRLKKVGSHFLKESRSLVLFDRNMHLSRMSGYSIIYNGQPFQVLA